MRGQNVLFSSKSDEWETPRDFFAAIDSEFHFDLDACATKQNRKCLRFFTRDDDALTRSWSGNVWCNPPYSNIAEWVKKASYEANMGGCEVVVLLIPARTDTRWFHEYLYNKPNVELRFIRGRLKFGGSKNSAPFPSMLAIFRREESP